jgi:pre-rRNA-processing protein TSR2
METQETTLIKAVRASVAIFPALQLAIEQGMGGSQAREKEEWLVSVTYDFIRDNKFNPEIYELEDFIGEIIDNEFDTVVDDGSLEILSRNIYQLCRLQREAREEELIQQLEMLEIQKQRLQFPKESMDQPPSTMSPSGTSKANTEETGMEVDDSRNEPDSEGWTVVNNRKRN